MISTQRNNLIDLLRFLAAISVTIYHFYYKVIFRQDNIYTNFFYNYGKLGVPAFFVISGYCILIALKHAKTPIEFIIRRFFRIFPPYWFSLLFTLFIVLILKLLYGANSVTLLPKSFHNIIATLCLVTYPIGHVWAINWVYWTLPYEVIFYIVMFFCSYLKGNLFTFALICLTLISCCLKPAEHGLLSFFNFWPLFGIGAALFKLLHDDKAFQPLNVILCVLTIFSFYPTQQTLSFFITICIITLLIGISHYKPLSDNPFSKLGDISYSIYLIHVPLTVYTIGTFRNILPLKGNVWLNPILDILLIIIVIAVSKLVYKYVEVPSINMGKRVAKLFIKKKLTVVDNKA